MKIFRLFDRTQYGSSEWRTWVALVSDSIFRLGGLIRIYDAQATIDFASVSAQSEAEVEVACLGVKVDTSKPPRVLISGPHVTGMYFYGYVSDTNKVKVVAVNFSSGAIDASSAVYGITVLMYS
jgi:hypothetical protein